MLPPDAALLAALRRSPAPMATELRAEFGLNEPHALEERFEALAAAGFVIEHHPMRGCRVLESPDRLIADDLWARLAAREEKPASLVREILVLAETGSTNDVAMRLGHEGVAGGVLVLAESQTAGRGRFGRRWESAPGRGVWMSLLLRPELPMEHWTRLTTWAGLAVAEAIDGLTGKRSLLKWPNDVHLDGRKAAGILIEAGSSDGTQRPFVVLGVGINANQEESDFPPELRETATSLRIDQGTKVDRPDLVVRLLTALERSAPRLADGSFAELVAEASRRSTLLGRWIRVQAPDGIAEGVAEALDEEGCLVLRGSEGERRRLLAGEVTLRG